MKKLEVKDNVVAPCTSSTQLAVAPVQSVSPQSPVTVEPELQCLTYDNNCDDSKQTTRVPTTPHDEHKCRDTIIENILLECMAKEKNFRGICNTITSWI